MGKLIILPSLSKTGPKTIFHSRLLRLAVFLVVILHLCFQYFCMWFTKTAVVFFVFVVMLVNGSTFAAL